MIWVGSLKNDEVNYNCDVRKTQMSYAGSTLVSFITFTAIFILIFNAFTGMPKIKIDESANTVSYVRQTNNTNKFSVCPRFSGRLGNQMFIFASSYATALSKKMVVEVQEHSELYKTFSLSVPVQNNRFSKCHSDIKILQEKQSSSFDRNILKFEPLSSVSLRTYLQSYLYFRNYSKEIRRQYVFRKHIKNKAISILKIVFAKYRIEDRKNHTIIGVHVRRGDMVTLLKRDKNVGYNLATENYLVQSVNYYQKKYKNVLFLVITNGIQWTKKHMPKGITVEFIHNYSSPVELATIAMCDHSITTVGTFSWWAGWLTGGEVIYFKWPAKEGSRFRKGFSFDYSDFFPSTWIGL